MKYSIDQLNEFMDKLQAEEKNIRIDRGKRYGNAEDTLANVSTFGSDGCIISMWECFMRAKNSNINPILKIMLEALLVDIKESFKAEKELADISNWVMDARNFLAYILCLETRELGQGEYNIPPEVTPVSTPQVVPWISPEYGNPMIPEGEEQ